MQPATCDILTADMANPDDMPLDASLRVLAMRPRPRRVAERQAGEYNYDSLGPTVLRSQPDFEEYAILNADGDYAYRLRKTVATSIEETLYYL